MKHYFIIILFTSVFVMNGYTQIVTTEMQGLKRSSLFNVEKINKPLKPLKVYDLQNFLIGGLSFRPSQVSMYAMVGAVKKSGLYGKLKSDLSFNGSYDYDIDATYINDFLIKDTKNGRFSITGGLMFRLDNPLSLYIGCGYGNRWLNWVSTYGDIYRIKDYSYKGFESEFGINFKYKETYFNVGIQANSFKYELNFGAGIPLKCLKRN